MDRLHPMEKLVDDYYLGEQGGNGVDSEDELSSDDELQAELRKLAGVRKVCSKEDGIEEAGRKRNQSEFEDDMESELDKSISDYATHHMNDTSGSGSVRIEEMPSDDVEMKELADSERQPANGKNGSNASEPTVSTATDQKSSQHEKAHSSKDAESPENEENPIKKLARDREKQIQQEEVDFYDAEEDDENEKWVQQRRQQDRGKTSKDSEGISKKTSSRPRIDDGSDAVLSCPGCMILLTRDCQRHELYNDQYRAMFVENCVVDPSEKLTIEKTGKEKRRERQRSRKLGVDKIEPTTEDIFLPVKCRVCSTKIAVMDKDEVYHFFNVLSGYA